MYRIPPTPASGLVMTNAVAGTTNSPILLAGPGVGKRYRLVWLSIAPLYTSDMTKLTMARWTLPGGAELPMAFGAGSGGPQLIVFPEPGILLPDNGALAMSNISGGVTQGIYWTAGYFLEID